MGFKLNQTKYKSMKKITLKTLNDATAQEVFDQVAVHLLTQKARSKGLTGCAYRSKEGLKCAAGCLIADCEYDPSFDDVNQNTQWKTLVLKGKVPDRHEILIMDLQNIHDYSAPEEWKLRLFNLAYENKLSSDFLREFVTKQNLAD